MLRALVLALTVAAGTPVGADVQLLMIEQPGCACCARWDTEVAPVYPRTPEGQSAPLERVQPKGPYPEDVALAPAPVFTPTFILVRDGRESGRIEGYPGEDFFWGLMARMLADAGEDPGKAAP